MTKTIEATFDGKNLVFDEPIELEPNTRVRVLIETIEPKLGEPYSLLDFLASLQMEGPADWSERLEENSEGLPQHGSHLS